MTAPIFAVMPHFNQHQFIKDAWRSVRGQVDKLIVVDDGSDSPAYLADICLPENMGAAYAINAGIRTALGGFTVGTDWLTWVSSDNWYEPGAFKMLAELAEKEGAQAAYSGFWYEEPGADRLYLYTPHTWKELVRREDCYYGPCFIIRADCWLDHNPGINHDYDNWLRVEEKIHAMGGKIVGLDRGLCHYRAHPKRATVARANEYHADKIRAEAIERRKSLGLVELLP